MSRDSDRLARTLANRFTPAEAPAAGETRAERWEDRHVRVTMWMDRDLRDELWAAADAEGLSRRAVADEMARAWLALASDRRARSTVNRPRSR